MQTSPPTDPLDALRQLTPAEIEERLATLRAEDAALRTILRSLRARERVRRRLASTAIASLPSQEAKQ